MYEQVLFWIFTVAFSATGILTILSLPNWVKIEEGYKSKLFKLFIVEIVAMVFILGNNLLISKYEVSPSGNWAALSDKGEILDSIIVKTGLKGEKLYSPEKLKSFKNNIKRNSYRLEKGRNNFFVITTTNNKPDTLGSVHGSKLNEIGYFSDFELRKASEKIEFIHEDRKLSKLKPIVSHYHKQLPFDIEIINGEGFYYNIISREDSSIYFKERGTLDAGHVDRNPFIIKCSSNNTWYYIEIPSADHKRRRKATFKITEFVAITNNGNR